MNYTKIDELLHRLKSAYEKLGCKDVQFIKEEKASPAEVERIEKQIGQKIPESLRDFFLNYSKRFLFSADLPESAALPYELRQIFCAYFEISLEEIPALQEITKGLQEIFDDNPEDEYSKVFGHKFGLMNVPNGDILGIGTAGQVVYISHDDGEGHGYVLGNSFADYFEKLVLIGGCGNEDWQMLPFCQSPTSGLDSMCPNAVTYREIIGYVID